ncbi:hypothetical protein [Mycobacterium sp. IS-3022]|uniref:hypothetical protein n=1 Tax=Mycobacterium sp. IS-3022 TaxID=1772277 RepID=UPI000A9A7C75|nr:hypothetical protein [Mycobacterium sp. IS-3022]
MPADETTTIDLAAAIKGVDHLHLVRNAGSNETVVRNAITEMLSDTYPYATRPWWVRQQILGAERLTRWVENGEPRWGSTDTIIGVTAVEYESDLRANAKFLLGRSQVAQYCAGLLNDGVPVDDVVGVLSDGVDWYAFRIKNVAARSLGDYAVEDFELEEVAHVTTTMSDPGSVQQLIDFFDAYLARAEKTPLTGAALAMHLGLQSGVGAQYLTACGAAIDKARAISPGQAALVDGVWQDFERYLSGGNPTVAQQRDAYVREFYLSLIARLICANVVSGTALRSSDVELQEILCGTFFDNKGLVRLVEHDFFGWLNRFEVVGAVLDIAREIQADLRAYNFATILDTDVFGTLMSQLADSTQRLLLGQEWTPTWLAVAMAREALAMLPADEWPRFTDVCAGSGSMIAAVCRELHGRLEGAGIERKSAESLRLLTQAVTGFDVDPLATLLAKVNWVVVNRDWLPMNGSTQVSIPIYNADSLFALAPIWGERDETDDHDTLHLDDRDVSLPRYLVDPINQTLFDAVLDRCTHLALVHVAPSGSETVDQRTLEQLVSDAIIDVSADLDVSQTEQLMAFARSLTDALVDLERAGRDGIWSFILRNSYRPSLVKGQFNGLITNPPWLAMSRLAGNPFASVLAQLADRFDLRPPGAAFPHLEMATVFLAYAVAHYLTDPAVVACVLPLSVTTGTQHEPLRRQLSGRTRTPIQMQPSKLWLVSKETFANLSAVLIGVRGAPPVINEIPAAHIGVGGEAPAALYVVEFAGRFLWSSQEPGAGIPGGYPDGLASQGADLMPRRLVAVTVESEQPGTVTVRSPKLGEPDWYLVSAAKKHEDFEIPATTIPARFRHKMWLSNHLVAFRLSEPADIVIPVLRSAGSLQLASEATISASPTARRHFDKILAESDFDSLTDFWRRGLNMRNKLINQDLIAANATGYLVVYGAGGEIPSAAYVSLAEYSGELPLIDQTLYWILVVSEDEAVYMCGLINNPSLAEYIRPYVPQGAFGGRHLHTLPPKAIPIFDATNSDHVAVVAETRALIGELEREVFPSVTTDGTLAQRRTATRRLIASLPSYGAYDTACANLYGCGQFGPAD